MSMNIDSQIKYGIKNEYNAEFYKKILLNHETNISYIPTDFPKITAFREKLEAAEPKKINVTENAAFIVPEHISPRSTQQ